MASFHSTGIPKVSENEPDLQDFFIRQAAQSSEIFPLGGCWLFFTKVLRLMGLGLCHAARGAKKPGWLLAIRLTLNTMFPSCVWYCKLCHVHIFQLIPQTSTHVRVCAFHPNTSDFRWRNADRRQIFHGDRASMGCSYLRLHAWPQLWFP